ncbi:hypothetical protein BHE74_00042124 [Ensete ventricosum]|nr:hypothetical protein BHE74_00042124 [Ensete ventricosum]RZS17673.1 hypothetical protein BHM03_00049846 [Ensete ventricosum]
MTMGKHKSRRGEGSSWGPFRGKEHVAPSEEPEPCVYRRPKSMKDLCGVTVHKNDKGYYILQMVDMHLKDPDSVMRARWPNFEVFRVGLGRPASSIGVREGSLASQLAKELYALPSKALMAMKENETLKVELPKKSIEDYKKSVGFRWGLHRMDQVSYEYRYRVALAWFQARYPDLGVDDDPFTERPEDTLVSMETQQSFDDSIPLES